MMAIGSTDLPLGRRVDIREMSSLTKQKWSHDGFLTFGSGQGVYAGDIYYYREYIRKKKFAKIMSSAMG
jgi:hypothetical protein